MTEIQKMKITRLVYLFGSIANITNRNTLDPVIDRLTNMSVEDAMDSILVSLADMAGRGAITQNDIMDNMYLLTDIEPIKYGTKDSLFKRLEFIRNMNMEHPSMPISENHELVIETFDKFNELIGTKFDSSYTGGLMGYLATNTKLVRYHGDLDLFINEEELEELKKLVDESDDFSFISNMDHKEENGHEFKITYKDTTMSIGLFLFERKENNEIVIKEYYHKDQNPENELMVTQNHLMPEYASLVFSGTIASHNGIPYKMQSLESMYHVKNKSSRPKDRYDASIVEEYVDKEMIERLNNTNGNYIEKTIAPIDNVVTRIEQSSKLRK